MLKVPVTVPSAAGSKRTTNVKFPLAAIVAADGCVVTEKPVPVTATIGLPDKANAAVPVL